MWYGPLLQMIDKHAHFRVVTEAAFLLVKSKMCWMQMYNKGREIALVFA